MLKIAICSLLLCTVQSFADDTDSLNGDAVIRGKAGGSEIVITTTNRLAGAIHSLTWAGKEFINSADHGRQLQSACSFDCGLKQPFWAECFNPTEAGSRKDGAGKTSTSKLLKIDAHDNELSTTIQMAFWLNPGEKSFGHPGLNTTVLSNHIVQKHVVIGYKQMPNVIQYDVTFTIPKNEHHNQAQFEALTGYMPPDFSEFTGFDVKTGELKPLPEKDGEQSLPVVTSTANGNHAMGIYSPDQPSKGFDHAGYGRFKFQDAKVNKWNCVFRVRNPDGVAPGDYKYRMFVIVGTKSDVHQTMKTLTAEFVSIKN